MTTSLPKPARAYGSWVLRSIFALVVVAAVWGAYLTAPSMLAAYITARPAMLSMRPVPGPEGGGLLEQVLSGRLHMRGEVWIRNALWIDVRLDRVDWTAYVNGRPVASGQLDPKLLLLADREENFALVAEVAVLQLGLAGKDVLDLGSAEVFVNLHYSASALGFRLAGERKIEGFDLRLNTRDIPLDAGIRRVPVEQGVP